MKIAVYTIALNESSFVERWYSSAKEADYIVMLDTGSTDNTVDIASKLGIITHQVKFKTFRFDDARNLSLSFVPDDVDYCICLDMDEILVPGWRKSLETALNGQSKVTRLRYEYTWSWKADKSPGLVYLGDKIHSRTGYVWKHPVHEVLVRESESPEVELYVPALKIEHYPDSTKTRSQYLPLLELAVKEDPSDHRNQFYYARELYFYGRYQEAIEWFTTYLNNPKSVWKPERAAALRYLAKCNPNKYEYYLKKSILEAPDRRESYLDLVLFYYRNSNWNQCLNYAEKALEVVNRPLEYLSESSCWDGTLEDIAAVASYNLGNYKKAVQYGVSALYYDKNNERLLNNLYFYAKKL
jgi:glycosyltransferase involved in cell wall biosynthesis